MNALIEDVLKDNDLDCCAYVVTLFTIFAGKLGIVCMEDLVHEIYTVGPNFRKANRFLWHFKLNNPSGGWRKKANHFVDGGDFGCREEMLNPLLRLMV